MILLTFFSHPTVFVTSEGELITTVLAFTSLGTIIAAIATWWHHINCIEKGCWHKGHPSIDHGHPVCRKHTEHSHPAFGQQTRAKDSQ